MTAVHGAVHPTRQGIEDALSAGRHFADEARFDENTRSRFLLSVGELMTNIVAHGKAPADSTVDYRFEQTGDGVRISLQDCGVPFDPRTDLPPRDPDADIAAGVEGGNGWALVLEWCRIESYSRAAGRNRVSLLLG